MASCTTHPGGHARDPLVRPSPGRRGAGPARRGPAGVLRRRDQLAQLGPAHARKGCGGASCSSTSGPTRASTGCGRRPYRRAWAAKYADAGLTVVGVHTPEFGFERDLDNVVPRTRALGVEYPVAVDSDYGVWRAFGNHFWPAIYLADAQGRIRYHHFGEGEYAMTEMVIQQLLIDAGATDVDRDLVDVEPRGPRGRRRLADAPVARDVRRLRPGDRLRIGGCGRIRRAARVRAHPPSSR